MSELRQIADETDRLESFVKDALQAAAWIWLASWMPISAGMWVPSISTGTSAASAAI
ncbi:MAG: hypothetical protein ACLRIS_06985 [Flavonifractor plautii]